MLRTMFCLFSLLSASSAFLHGCDTTKQETNHTSVTPGSPPVAVPSAPIPGVPGGTAAGNSPVGNASPGGSPGMALNPANNEFLFCFWNVENLFDDIYDKRTGQGDKEYDPWYAENHGILQEKLFKHVEALLSLNNGRGPDIIGICECESLRAAQLLQWALNQKVHPSLQYQTVQFREVRVGRHIAPALISRVPVVADKTKLLQNGKRILHTVVKVNNQELNIILAHWTSRLREEQAANRSDYADVIYGACKAMVMSNPNVDILIAGDFNDTPQDVSVVKHLHATGDLQQIRSSKDLMLYNLMADKSPDAGFGTLYYNKWQIFDQVVVSPGMLDNAGWQCAPGSMQTINYLVKPGDRKKAPWRFGGEKDPTPRGYSDHFPITVAIRAL